MNRKVRRFVPVATAFVIAMPVFVAAQTTSPSAEKQSASTGLQVKSLQELDDDNKTVRWNDLSVDQLEDMDIVNAAGDQIGEVEEVLADDKGNIVAITAEVGGILGIGDKELIIGLDQVELQGDRLMTPLSSEQLEAMPRWDDD
jgi:sporulation protein YlmC with PRC-barrel domain